MSTAMVRTIRSEVLDYLRRVGDPMPISTVAQELRRKPGLSAVTDSEIRDVVRPMIVTGKVSLSTQLKIQLGQEDTAPISR